MVCSRVEAVTRSFARVSRVWKLQTRSFAWPVSVCKCTLSVFVFVCVWLFMSVLLINVLAVHVRVCI
jgi:hypothetical protein